MGPVMQLASLITLLSSPSSAAPSADAAGHSAEGSSGDAFAQLLSDTESHFTSGSHSADNAALAEDVAAIRTSGSAALLAQEVMPGISDTLHVSSAAALQQPITPEEAAAALAKLPVQPGEDRFSLQLKETLKAIANGNANVSIAALADRLSAGTPTKATTLATSLLAWIKPGAALTGEVATESSDTSSKPLDASDNALLESLQASMFRTDVAPPSPAPQPAATQGQEQIVITPLKAMLTVALSQTDEQDAQRIASDDLDARIPPLTSTDSSLNTGTAAGRTASDTDAHATSFGALPDISLPTLSAASAEKSSTPADRAAFVDMLAALPQARRMADTGSQDQSSTLAAATDAAAQKAAEIPAPSFTAAHAYTADISAPSRKPSEEDKVSQTTAGTTGTAATPVAVIPGDTPRVPMLGTLHQTTHSSAIAAPVTEQVHVAVARASKSGIDRVTIQLDPAELGRVEVSMQRHADGQTHIAFMVDKPSTLDALARHAHGLEQALQDAGVKTDTGSMQFNLRQQPSPQAQTGDSGGSHGQHASLAAQAEENASTENTAVPVAPAIAARQYTLTMREGLDIRA